MKLLYLSVENLRDTFFIKDLVHNIPGGEKVILVHEHFPHTLNDTRFVTRRLSAMLSEALVVNSAFSGEQRNLLLLQNGELRLDTGFLEKQLSVVPVILMNAIASAETGPQQASPLELAKIFISHFGIEERFVFTGNFKSPLAASKEKVSSTVDFDRLIALYEEEKTALQNALSLAPATVASPVNFAK